MTTQLPRIRPKTSPNSRNYEQSHNKAGVSFQMGDNKCHWKSGHYGPQATVRRHSGAQNREKRLLWGWSKLLVLVLLWQDEDGRCATVPACYGPTVTDAAPCTFLHEGREAVIRCTMHKGPHGGTDTPFTPTPPMAANRASLFPQT